MKSRKVSFMGLMIALAMIFSFVESQIPAFVAIPGIKVGLPNLVIVFLLFRFGWKEAVTVSLIRILLISLLFGNLQTLTFSVAGAVLSLIGMILVKKTRLFSTIAISVLGGVLHNVGQIIAACLWTATPEVAFYLPVLLISGTIAGTVIGIIAGLIVKKFETFKLF